MTVTTLDAATVETWLREEDETRLNELWQAADACRRQHVGDAVHLRGLLEISNHCRRQCHYCGLHASNTKVTRYRMAVDEILACAEEAKSYGYGTVVMQAGEDLGLRDEQIAEVVRRIKAETGLAMTLSLGERGFDAYRRWREAGADRYLLRFETGDPELFCRIHPPLPGQPVSNRKAILLQLRELGYEIGSGVMVGIPGQTWASLAADVLAFRELDLDMIGVGPYIAHPETELGWDAAELRVCAGQEQVPSNELMTYKVVALARLLCPDANIPSTTALATLNTASGRENGLNRGANVVMPNVTPPRYRIHYTIYPSKACIDETAEECQRCLSGRIKRIGRFVGTGPGNSRRLERHQETNA